MPWFCKWFLFFSGKNSSWSALSERQCLEQVSLCWVTATSDFFLQGHVSGLIQRELSPWLCQWFSVHGHLPAVHILCGYFSPSAPMDVVVFLTQTGANLSENNKQAGKNDTISVWGRKSLAFLFPWGRKWWSHQCSAFPCSGGCPQLPRRDKKEAACDYLGWECSGHWVWCWKRLWEMGNKCLPWSCIPGGIASQI